MSNKVEEIDSGGISESENNGEITGSFAKVNGTGFILDDKPYYVIGANYWQAMNLGMVKGNRSRVIQDLKTLKENGINCVRIMAGSEGPPGEPQRMYPALMNSPGEYDESVFEGLDWFLDQLRHAKMTAIMTLSNYWQWSGGFAQYVYWADNSSQIPYPEWGKDFTPFIKYAERFYSDPKVLDTCQKYYLDHVRTVVNRKNTVNGIVYKDDPVIFSWELANEPQDVSGENGHEYVYKWIDSTAGYIKSLDKNHLVTSGAEGKHGKDWFITMHRSKHIDFTSAHIWVENWGYYKSDDSSIENFKKAENFMLNFLQSVSDWSTDILHKPILLGEYGMARDAWSGVSKYSPDATTTNRDKYFTAIANKILELEKQKKFTGHMFWAYSGIARPSDNYPQWIGDPPHEPPGWYSVYDADKNTLKIFAAHFKEILKLIN
ncbi:16583_t:CDS:2 [Acaulospora morrowiae]|uniref:mannan endo-1,4-beta-mannosidase n=1 Tax=Acaulospora morrowiae TaxID=94023 RepID=A0A9N9GFX9_9GLOM|nr:16583_t:CDS:2 [Acaulospora morrowiae]